MVELGGGVFQTRLDVVRLKVGIIREDFRFGNTRRDEVEHVFDADAHPPGARPSTTLIRVEGDARHVIHAGT